MQNEGVFLFPTQRRAAMGRFVLLLLLVARVNCMMSNGTAAVAGVAKQTANDPGPAVSDTVYSIGYRVLNGFRTFQPNASMVFSPLSLTTALGLVYFGSAGMTRKEMISVLGFQMGAVPRNLLKKSGPPDVNGSLSVANRVFIAEDARVNRNYQMNVGVENAVQVPFGRDPLTARNEINSFVSNQTKGLIPDLLSADQVNALTRIVLVNAVYFKGDWAIPFPPDLTFPGIFKGVRGTSTVEYMTYGQAMQLRSGYIVGLNSTVVELPYATGDFAMYILFPDAQDGWKRVEEELAIFPPTFLGDSLGFGSGLDLTIPKWDVESDLVEIINILRGMGLINTLGGDSNFSRLTRERLQLTSIVHRAKLKVDEKGTEAAAATAATFTRSLPDQLFVNHPFLYFIIDGNDGSIVFQGTVTSLP